VARGPDEGERAAAEIRRSGGTAVFQLGDVTELASMQRAAAAAAQQYGRIDILCANAGIFPSASLADLSEAQWDTVFDLNVKGTLFSVQACLPYLQKSEAGRVIVTSSITGITGLPGWSHYAASKAAQLGFIRTAAIELAKYNITINACCRAT
jgi:3-oxoacyl-[acyl-carrier protein] reductase